MKKGYVCGWVGKHPCASVSGRFLKLCRSAGHTCTWGRFKKINWNPRHKIFCSNNRQKDLFKMISRPVWITHSSASVLSRMLLEGSLFRWSLTAWTIAMLLYSSPGHSRISVAKPFLRRKKRAVITHNTESIKRRNIWDIIHNTS